MDFWSYIECNLHYGMAMSLWVPGSGIWWYEWEWPPQVHLCLVPSWWNCWKGLGDVAFWEEMFHWGWSFAVRSLSHACGSNCGFLATIPVLCLLYLVLCFHHGGHGLKSSGTLNLKLNPVFYKVVWIKMLCHSHWKVTKISGEFEGVYVCSLSGECARCKMRVFIARWGCFSVG